MKRKVNTEVRENVEEGSLTVCSLDPIASAAALNAAKLFGELSLALMDLKKSDGKLGLEPPKKSVCQYLLLFITYPTIPMPQCNGIAQWNQMAI